MTMLPSFINSSDSPTTLPSLLLRTCHAPVSGISWVVKVPWDHINSCLRNASNWTCAHDHVLRALERICNDPIFATTHKRVLTSEGNRHADLKIRNTMGRLKASSATPTTRTTSIRNYRDTYRRNRHAAFFPACMSTSGRIHGYLLRLIFFISNKQVEDYFESSK